MPCPRASPRLRGDRRAWRLRLSGWGEFERVRDECRPRYVALHDTGTLKTAKVEAYLETHTDEYRLLLRKGETDASPACDLVGCLPEGLFAPNEAGWAIYQRSDY